VYTQAFFFCNAPATTEKAREYVRLVQEARAAS